MASKQRKRESPGTRDTQDSGDSFPLRRTHFLSMTSQKCHQAMRAPKRSQSFEDPVTSPKSQRLALEPQDHFSPSTQTALWQAGVFQRFRYERKKEVCVSTSMNGFCRQQLNCGHKVTTAGRELQLTAPAQHSEEALLAVVSLY